MPARDPDWRSDNAPGPPVRRPGGLARQSSSPASLHCSIDFAIRTSILLRMVLGRAIATPRGLPFPFRQLHRSPVMSIALPFVAFLLAGAFAAYHRLRLAWWAAITAPLLVGCWPLGANPVATVIAGALPALIALPLLIPALRKPLDRKSVVEGKSVAGRVSFVGRRFHK